jgi:carboxymethylenebutenolidase
VGSYGGKDGSLRDVPERLQAVLAQAGTDHDVHVYPDAGHSFMNDHDPREAAWIFRMLGRITGSRFHEPSARDARRRIEAFFERHLRAPAA